MQPASGHRLPEAMFLTSVPAVVEYRRIRSDARLVATHPLGGVIEVSLPLPSGSVLLCHLFSGQGRTPALLLEAVVLRTADNTTSAQGFRPYLTRWNWAACLEGIETLCARMRALLAFGELDVSLRRLHQLPDGKVIYALHDDTQKRLVQAAGGGDPSDPAVPGAGLRADTYRDPVASFRGEDPEAEAWAEEAFEMNEKDWTREATLLGPPTAALLESRAAATHGQGRDAPRAPVTLLAARLRDEERVPVKVPCHFAWEGIEGTGHLRDISAHGVSVGSDDLLPGEGAQIYFSIPMQYGGRLGHTVLVGAVKWVAPAWLDPTNHESKGGTFGVQVNTIADGSGGKMFGAFLDVALACHRQANARPKKVAANDRP